MLSCSIWFSAPSFWMDGGLDSRCVGRVCGAVRCGADVAVRRHGNVSTRVVKCFVLLSSVSLVKRKVIP